MRLTVPGSAPCSAANERDVELGASCSPSHWALGVVCFPLFSVSDFIAIVVSDNATEEFKRISEFMRTYLLLRLFRLTPAARHVRCYL